MIFNKIGFRLKHITGKIAASIIEMWHCNTVLLGTGNILKEVLRNTYIEPKFSQIRVIY